ncbi:MAG: MATE family efflux transporter [Ruminococcaceae bacterium]|nr:MATE family efflux transporter [Oscillospiraceae bacterium]
MKIQLSDHFTYKKLFRFTLPSIVMMIFTSIYGVVDGFFVSNFVGETPFEAVNFVMPVLMILGGFGFMFGTGGSALVAKTMGEGNREKANRQFSFIVYASLVFSVILMVLGFVFLRPVTHLLGAEGEMLDDCVLYGNIIMIALPAYILQFEFQTFFVTAEKPQLGLLMTVISGVCNMLLDFLLVAAIPLGLVGAAVATAASQLIGGFVPLIYFTRPNSSILRLGRAGFDGFALFRTCTNGSSELMSNISMSLVNMLYNFQLLKYAGNDGVAAYGVMMYVNLLFLSIFIGYSVGTAPVISHHYGAGNHKELKSLLRKSSLIICASSVAMLVAAFFMASPVGGLFVGYNPVLLKMTVDGFKIYSFMFLFAGMGIFGSSFFTALNNGFISAVIAFLRTVVFQIAAVLLLPMALGIDGIWWSVVLAEGLATVVTVILLFAMKKQYKY